MVYRDGTVLLQIVHNLIQVLRVVDRHGYTYFRCADHVDGCLIAFEDFEHLAQETMSQQHTAGFDFDGRDVVLGSDCLDFAFFRVVRNQRTRSRWFHGVQQTYRDVGIFGRLDAGGVQNLGTEVSQFSSLLKVQLTDRRSLVHHARVIVVHTVDVRPNLDFRRVDGCTDQRSRIVASATLQVVDFTVCIAADKSLRDINLIARIGFQLCVQFLADVRQVRFTVFVRAHVFQCRNQYRLHALFAQIVCHHVCRDDFSLCQDDLFFKKRKYVFRVRTNVIKNRFYEIQCFLFIFFGRIQLINVLFIFRFQSIDDFICTFWIFLVQIIRNFNQCVRCTRHGRQDYNFLFAVID